MSDRRSNASAIAQFDAKLTPAPAVATPRIATFHQFLIEVARVRIQSGAAAGTYAPYTFKGRAALVQIVHCIDFILGSTTGKPLKDAKLGLAGGAQFGKTTLELNLAAYLSACRFLNPIIYLPDDKLADDIVDAKFRPDVIDQVPWFAEMTKVGRAVNESGKAVNTKGAFLVTDGTRKAVGMFRGLQKPPTSFTADVVVEDVRLGVVAGGHGQQVADRHAGQPAVVGRGWRLVRKERHDGVVERQPSLGDGEADSGRREGLRQRVERVRAVGGERCGPALGDHVPVAHHHERVQLGDRDDRVEGGEDGSGVDTLSLGRAARQ